MFYNLHRDAIIGYKKLSQADLGISSGNQTHIGLFENTLEFISSHHQLSTSQLIYNNDIIETETFLDYIQRPDGSFRSPKIRSSSINSQSTVRTIREISSQNQNTNWYLMWFGLENEDLIFLLIEENSLDFNYFLNLLDDLTRGYIQQSHPLFSQIIQFLNTKVNNLNFNYFQELELFAQTNERDIINKKSPKKYDIEKAQALFQKIGKEGEELVNEHLLRKKSIGEIKNFQWMNKNSESGLPFDFEIIHNNGHLIYSDAKSTSYKFEQKMIFSSQELRFINENKNYMVHRVFNLNNTPELATCENIANITNNFIDNYIKFKNNLKSDDIYINSMKISVPPTNNLLSFKKEVI